MRREDYDVDDRLLFWVADTTGWSIDRLYRSRFMRCAMMLARMASSIFDRSPR